jgi:transposase-like protein
MADETKTTERKRRRISPEDKVRILQEILLKGKKVSEAAEKNDVHPTKTT